MKRFLDWLLRRPREPSTATKLLAVAILNSSAKSGLS